MYGAYGAYGGNAQAACPCSRRACAAPRRALTPAVADAQLAAAMMPQQPGCSLYVGNLPYKCVARRCRCRVPLLWPCRMSLVACVGRVGARLRLTWPELKMLFEVRRPRAGVRLSESARQRCGTVLSCEVKMDETGRSAARRSPRGAAPSAGAAGRSRGFGIVHMSSPTEAYAAIGRPGGARRAVRGRAAADWVRCAALAA